MIRAATAAAAAAAALLLGAAAGPDSAPFPAIRLISPPAHCATAPGRVRVLLATRRAERAPVLTLDGRPVAPLLRLQRPAGIPGDPGERHWTCELTIGPGTHVVRNGRQELLRIRRVEGGALRDTPEWPLLRPHVVGSGQRLEPCAACHSTGSPLLGIARTPESCHQCHAEVQLPEIHRHVMDPLRRCASCHDPHGAARVGLLREPRDRLCVRCHEAGHSRR